MAATIATGCPWCGEELVDASASQAQYDYEIEGHAQECAVFLAELGGEVA